MSRSPRSSSGSGLEGGWVSWVGGGEGWSEVGGACCCCWVWRDGGGAVKACRLM